VPTKIFGLPAHVLLIHLVVVLVPLTSLAVVLHAAWPAARRRLGVVTPLLGLVSLVLVPVTTNAGDYLERFLITQRHYGGQVVTAIERHERLGRELIWYAIALFVVTVGVWALGRYQDGASIPGIAPAGDAARTAPQWLSYATAGVAIAVAVATSIELYRIGDAGAHATWDGICCG